MKTMNLLASAAVAATLCGCMDRPVVGERKLCDGVNAAVSPDGTKVAYQQLSGSVFRLGTLDLKTGRTDWIEDGPGMAAYPAWTPSGALVYTYGNDSMTSYQAWKAKIQSAYGLRIWENGVKRDLTTGRCRDYTPTVSPDGKRVYFASTRWVVQTSKVYSNASTSMIGYVDIAGGEPKMVIDSPNGSNTGVVQPAVSPDGKLLLWGHLQNFFQYWRIYGAKLSDTSKDAWCPVTPEGLVAISPRWHPDGKVFCFTGYLKDDPDWGVWVEDITTGKVRRLCDGQNPSFSPDGKSIVYDRDRSVFIRPFGPADWPDREMATQENPQDEPERVILAKKGPFAKQVSEPGDAKMAFGMTSTFFVRAKVKWSGKSGFRQYVVGDYAENALGFQLYQNADLWFATRNAEGTFVGACRKFDCGPGEHVFTGIRTEKCVYVSIDGSVPSVHPVPVPLALDHPNRLFIAKNLQPGEEVRELEIGTGWPTNVPKEKNRKDLLK